MKCYVLSDLHLEFCNFEMLTIGTKADTLVLAGDIGVVAEGDTKRERLEEFLEVCCAQYNHVIYVAGNHEFYYSDYHRTKGELKSLSSENVKLQNLSFLDKDVVEINGVSFIGATLWTSMNDMDTITLFECQRCMADFHHIEYKGRELSPRDVAKIHQDEVNFIFESVVEEKRKGNTTVVVTHHLPSFHSVHKKYLGSSLNGGFVTDLEDEIRAFKPDYWVHGHTHESFAYSLGDTMVYCNPRGYSGFDKNGLFNETFNFTL